MSLPVEIREASACTATYLVRADAARAVIAYSGLDVVEPLPHRAICTLLFVRYTDGDLGAYNEFGVGFLVRPPHTGPTPAGRLARLMEVARAAGSFVHWLPVDQGFTLEAGRSIWGFPKEMADIDLRMSSPFKRCIVRKHGRTVIDLLVRPGIPLPGLGVQGFSAAAFTHRDDVTRRVPFQARAYGLRARPGGALIRLGNHPVAKELEELGLPKRPLFTTTMTGMQMTFNPAKPA